jgi:hypothetical protein
LAFVPVSAKNQPLGSAVPVPLAARLSKVCTAGAPPTRETSCAKALGATKAKSVASAARAAVCRICMETPGEEVRGGGRMGKA